MRGPRGKAPFALLGLLSGALALPFPAAAAGRSVPAGPVTVVAAGDIACDPGDPEFHGGAGSAKACRMRATSDQALALHPAAVLLLGDLQYENATLAKFQLSFDPTWGRLRALSHPAVGNHEYLTPGAAGYFAYFGAAAGDPAKGYYSFDLGGWHLVALNSNCEQVGGCGATSPQVTWLGADLRAHSGACTLAYWHHPRFSSSLHGTDATYQPFWEALQAGAADLVLVGHDHVYERFAPQDAAGGDDPLTGIRELVVGTGGRLLYSFNAAQPHSEVRNSDTYGVLQLTLHATGYNWNFLPEAGKTFSDSGSGTCH
ncbi:MAG TPA: metallophosphoesterase [Thermoanaerobaculia bacterium]|nr:metallophosphoesterase [Thermoanaerobaculia bacterium]